MLPAWGLVRLQVQEEGSSRRQEAGSEHTATAAALQLQDAAGDPSGGQRPAQLAGPHGRGEWGASLQEEADPVSPASSSGSALDPQLFRFAFVSAKLIVP